MLQRVAACLFNTAVQKLLHGLEIPRRATQSSNVLVEEPGQVEKDTTSQKKKAGNLRPKPGLISETSGLGE